MKTNLLIAVALVILCGCKKNDTSIPDQTEVNKLKINQIQLLGSHNSYHKHMDQKLYDVLKNLDFLLPAQYQITALDYYQEPFEDQLDIYKLRSFEIDIYADPNGGRFYNRQGNALIGKPTESGIPELQQPGFKVLHIPDIDFETHFYTLKSALQFLKGWSDNHPDHIPIMILIESKEQTIGDVIGFLGFQTAIKFTPALADDIDTELKSVFGNDLSNVITPDMVRGNYPTLNEAVLANNWPTLGASRGKFIFVMQGPAVDDYVNGHPSLQGRAMFVNVPAGRPESAIIGIDKPDTSLVAIQNYVREGYIIRTRADEETQNNISGSYARQEAAFESGGQMISTDYYRPDPRFYTDPHFTSYKCVMPNGDVARVNPVNAADKVGVGTIAE